MCCDYILGNKCLVEDGLFADCELVFDFCSVHFVISIVDSMVFCHLSVRCFFCAILASVDILSNRKIVPCDL